MTGCELIQSGEDVGVLIIIIVIAFVLYSVFKRPSKRTLEKIRQEEEHDQEMQRLQKEHGLEMQRLQQEEQRLKTQAEEEQSIPSGRGKVFKAKKD